MLTYFTPLKAKVETDLIPKIKYFVRFAGGIEMISHFLPNISRIGHPIKRLKNRYDSTQSCVLLDLII